MMRATTLRTRTTTVGVLSALLIALLLHAPFAQAVSEAEKSFLNLYFTEDELHVVSATRSLQSISRVAENVEVVTAEDIELMNAHTLADVLNTVTGVAVYPTGGFGSTAIITVQGTEARHATVLLDGVPLNDVANNLTEVAFIPVTDIERVEVLKGPASSAWGSALGGVVNVITKGPGPKPFQGMASLDYGSKNSADYRAAVSGRAGRLGYYLSGTGRRTDGLTEGFDVDLGFLGAKLDYALTDRTSARLHVSYGNGSRGDGSYPAEDLAFDRHNHELVSDLLVTSVLGRQGRLDLTLWHVDAHERYFMRQLTDGLELSRTVSSWTRTGGGLRNTWDLGAQDLVLGVDYSTARLDTSDIPGREPEVTQWAVYANDTIGLGPLTLAPGIRYDDISISDNFLSPSLGLTYALSRDLLLRATVARGFSVPSPFDTDAGTSVINGYTGNPDLKVEKIWSYQAGIEANVLDAFWLKVSAFRHDLDEVFTGVQFPDGTWTTVNGGRQRREGVEAQVKTVPFHDFTLAAGGILLRARDRETGEEVPGVLRNQVNASLKYDDGRSLRGLLIGHYYYEKEPEGFNESLHGFVFDLNLMKRLLLGPAVSLEAFLSVHNLFNGAQYYADIFKNPRRWVEGGLRVSF